ncbi:MerR family transcriptional regulator [Kribbella sp. NBC_00889]|uniref:MerR family transcriptional regulator n=1 Tax=Kribbella sp. NBC_00889 TaxID=2975974 RepID=UPI003865772D|nr:cobalamin B12-binding domain-containing protein [Kribbella sp. NBC_00889]
MDSVPGLLRIGELSRRVGVSDHVLRAWENRYGLLSPVRSAGGFRLYSEHDERRVRRMQAELAKGLSAAQAARVALADELPPETGLPELRAVPANPAAMDGAAAAFGAALDAMDEPGAHGPLDQLLNEFTVETVLRDVVIPYLHDLGERVARGEAGIGQEHFASHVIRGRLAGLARGWGGGQGPLAVLACPPDEHHDLALMVFGIVLARNGWRIRYLGANTPITDLLRIAADTTPAEIVLAAAVPERLTPIVAELRELASAAPVALAGAGASQSISDEVGAQLLAGDPVTEAVRLARSQAPL